MYGITVPWPWTLTRLKHWLIKMCLILYNWCFKLFGDFLFKISDTVSRLKHSMLGMVGRIDVMQKDVCRMGAGQTVWPRPLASSMILTFFHGQILEKINLKSAWGFIGEKQKGSKPTGCWADKTWPPPLTPPGTLSLNVQGKILKDLYLRIWLLWGSYIVGFEMVQTTTFSRERTWYVSQIVIKHNSVPFWSMLCIQTFSMSYISILICSAVWCLWCLY